MTFECASLVKRLLCKESFTSPLLSNIMKAIVLLIKQIN